MKTIVTLTGKQMRYLRWKRLLDLLISAAALLVLLPLLLLIGLAIKLDSRGPVLFRQKRAGRGDSFFEILKFRTMRCDAPRDVPTHMLKDAGNMTTSVGKFLRKTSLDELPQLLNIFMGQMSLIGPRPALWNQEDLIAGRKENGANLVPPGLTGWAQINGRDELPLSEKIRLDGEYAKRFSFTFDCKCFFRTFAKVLKREGIAEGGKSG